MQTWIQTHWRAGLLNGLGLAVLAGTLGLPRGSEFLGVSEAMISAGKWAARFLLITLAITPLNTLFGWRSLIKLRRTAGLWTFAFAALHFALYFLGSGRIWFQHPIPDLYAGLGVVGLLIFAVLALTSTDGAKRRLGRWWTRLHKLVYAAGVLGLAHGLLETGHKFVAMNQPDAAAEIWVYLAVLAALLAMRIPLLRRWLARLRFKLPRAGRVEEPSATP